MRSRHAVVGLAVLALIGSAFLWQRTQSERSSAVRLETGAQEIPASKSVRLDSPVEASESIRDVPLAPPTTDAARVSQTEEVRWAHVEVTGTIVDERGEPVSNALVMLLARPPGTAGGAEEQALAQLSTPASGRFELQASMPKREFLVHASHPDHESARSEVLAPGANQVSLVLPTLTGAISGQILVDARVDPLELLVVQRIERPESPPERPDINVGPERKPVNHSIIPGDSRARVKPDGSFILGSVHEGASILCVTSRDMLEEFARIENVQVSRNATTHDQRLEPLDLRGILHRYDLHVVDRSGQPVRTGRAEVIADRTPGLVCRTRIQDGYVRFITALDCVDVELNAPDLRDQIAKCVSADREVVMSEGLTVRVMLDKVPAHDADQEIIVELVTQESGSVRNVKSLQDDGTVTFRIGAPGWYGVRARLDSKLDSKWVTLDQAGSGSAASSAGTMLSGKVIEMFRVLDVPGEQFFRVALPPAAERDAGEDAYK